jgi:hypothetical protein
MEGIYELRRWDGLRCHDIHTKFHEDWFSHSKVDEGDTQTHRQHGDLISLLLFFQKKESRLIIRVYIYLWSCCVWLFSKYNYLCLTWNSPWELCPLIPFRLLVLNPPLLHYQHEGMNSMQHSSSVIGHGVFNIRFLITNILENINMILH